MSLQIEQRLLDSYFIESEPSVYTTGAHLVPMKILIDGNEKYVWVVTEFDNDTFFDGENCSVNVIADSKNNLIEQD